jgi:hypothetical protein
VLESLRRLRVIKLKPRYKSWALALRTLHTPPYIPSGHRGRGKERGHRLDLVVCDGLGDGLWPERWAEEERGGRRKGTGKDAGIRAAEDVGMRDVMDGIARLRKELGAVVVISVQGYWVSGCFTVHHGSLTSECLVCTFSCLCSSETPDAPLTPRADHSAREEGQFQRNHALLLTSSTSTIPRAVRPAAQFPHHGRVPRSRLLAPHR